MTGTEVVIDQIGDEFILAEESGQTLEYGFETPLEAAQFATEVGYEFVDSFFI